MNNLLLQLNEQHPRFQELVNINDHLIQNSNPITYQSLTKLHSNWHGQKNARHVDES